MEQKTRVVAALVEGNSVRSTVRMTGVAKNTVLKLVLDLADACAAYHNRNVRNLRVRRLQCDEIWQYVGAKAKNTRPEKKAIGWGDVWTWTGLDADTKLCVSYLVGGRDLGWAKEFMADCASRIKNRVQIVDKTGISSVSAGVILDGRKSSWKIARVAFATAYRSQQMGTNHIWKR